MKYTDIKYQAKILNRLAELAYRKGGLPAMEVSIEKATDKIWRVLEAWYRDHGVEQSCIQAK